jgi:hypothetical protein
VGITWEEECSSFLKWERSETFAGIHESRANSLGKVTSLFEMDAKWITWRENGILQGDEQHEGWETALLEVSADVSNERFALGPKAVPFLSRFWLRGARLEVCLDRTVDRKLEAARHAPWPFPLESTLEFIVR